MKINFKCPKCGEARIEEIMGGVTVASEVSNEATYQGDGEIELQYGDQSNEDGEVERYQCQGCGFKLGSTSQELMTFLRKHKMVEFDSDDAADEESKPKQKPVRKTNVHTEHCCKNCGCKYGDEDCPVVNGGMKQSYPCNGECGQ